MADTAPNPIAKAKAESYLASLLGKNLRVSTTDARMFLGQFKCTDSDQNIILSQTFEYRLPAPPKFIPISSSTDSSSSTDPSSTSAETSSKPKTITQDLTSRYLGLVVVPGEHITKIYVEEYISQLSPAERAVWERSERGEETVEGGFI